MNKGSFGSILALVALLLAPASRSDALQEYPLDALRFQGAVDVGGTTFAMVLAPDGQVHRVQVGSILGEHHGRVGTITRQGLLIIEPADAARGTAERRIELGFGASSNPSPAALPPVLPLATACEQEVRAHAVVSEITDRGPTQNGGVTGYRIGFRGQPGAVVVAQCWRTGDKVTVAYSEAGQDALPRWDGVDRPRDLPAGASSCDTDPERKSFVEGLRGTDAKRLVARIAARDSKGLVLRLDDGSQVRFDDDQGGCEEDCARYHFVERRASMHAYVLYVDGGESTGFLVVDSRNGTRMPLVPGYPVWSPSGRWMVVDASDYGAYDNVSLLIQAAQRSDGKPDFLVGFGAAKYCVVGWNDDTALTVRELRKGRPGELYRQTTRHLAYDGRQWRFAD